MNQGSGYIANLGDVTLLSLQNVWFKFLQFLPNIIAAIVLLIIGWIIAVVLGNIVRRVVHATGVDTLIDRSGLNARLRLSPNYHLLSRALGALVKWLILIFTLVAMAGALNLPQITDFLNQVVAYIPRAFVAVIILTIALLAADFVADILVGAFTASRLPIRHQKTLASVARYATIVFGTMAALTELNIVPQLIEILFGGLVLALALAFGLGGREEAARFLTGLREGQ